jgi:hypothetical protein
MARRVNLALVNLALEVGGELATIAAGAQPTIVAGVNRRTS